MLMASRGLPATSPTALAAASRRLATLAIRAFQAAPAGTALRSGASR
jgi:hypothetical protein